MDICKNCRKPIHKVALLNNGEIWVHEDGHPTCQRTLAEPLVIEEKKWEFAHCIVRIENPRRPGTMCIYCPCGWLEEFDRETGILMDDAHERHIAYWDAKSALLGAINGNQ